MIYLKSKYPKKTNDAESKLTFFSTNINFKKSEERNLNNKILILPVASKSSSSSDDSLGRLRAGDS